MELTYTNHNRVEQGVIQDFTLDLAYGKDENNFEIVTSENVLQQGFYWYIPDTEYGGIVDEIEATTNQGSVIYRGRSLQGILDTYNMLEIKAFDGLVIDNDNLIINALPSQILSGIISQLQLPFNVSVGSEEVVSMTVERNQGVYTFLRNTFEPNNYKIKFDTFTITITGTIDYASDDYFDTTQYAVKVKNSSKIPNHLIGVFKRDGENTIVKHLYFNEEGEVQPYYQLDSMHGLEPLHDYEYERVPDNKVITGIDEVVEVIEGGSCVETMDLVTELTDQDGNTPFVDGKPYDWDEKVYTDYYLWDSVSESGEIQYKNPTVENEYEAFTVDDSQPLKPSDVEYSFNWWKNHWNECYKKEGTEYIQLSQSDCTTTQATHHLDQLPNDWEKNYAKYSYYVSSQGGYQNFEGVPVYDYDIQRKQGSAWNENKGDFYIYVTKKRWKFKVYLNGKLLKTDYCDDSLKNIKIDGIHSLYDVYGNVKKTFKNPKGNKYSTAKYKIYAPTVYWKGWMSLNDYCAYAKKKLENIKFEKNKYALKYEKYRKAPDNIDLNNIYLVWDEITDTPPYKNGSTYKTFYFPKDLVKPAYEQGLYYRKVKNNYGELVKTMLEKYNDIVSKLNVIEPQIDTDLMEFDVGDIIGSTHPFTHEQLQAKISKKIVKGGTKGLTVSYEI